MDQDSGRKFERNYYGLEEEDSKTGPEIDLRKDLEERHMARMAQIRNPMMQEDEPLRTQHTQKVGHNFKTLFTSKNQNSIFNHIENQ